MAEIADPDQAAAMIEPGACVGLGGTINAAHPAALVRALIRARVSGLTLVGLVSGLGLDMLVAAGACRRLVAAYVGAERFVSLPPAIRWAAEDGELEVWENEEGVHLASLRARAQRLPYATWVGGIGTDIARHPLVEEASDGEGAPYFKVRPLEVDVSMVWAEAADTDGNLLLWGADMGDEALRAAANLRIAQVERVVPTEVLAKHPDRVVPWAADVVVPAPFGTHPFAGTTLAPDSRWLTDYGKTIAEARRAGNRELVSEFLDRWVRDVDGEVGYLEAVGIARLRELVQ